MSGSNEADSRRTSPDFSIFRTVAKNQLIHLLESVGEPKDLVLDDDLMRPLDRIVGASVLKEHGVSCIYKLENQKLLHGAVHRLYLFRPSVRNISMIAAQISADQAAGKERTYRLVMMPRRSALCEKLLEREGIYGCVTFDEFPLDFIALDDDVLSMEYGMFFKEYFVNKSFAFHHALAGSLLTFEGLFGRFQNVHMFGRCSSTVLDMKQKFQEEQATDTSHRVASEVSTLILIDRDVDYTAAVLSPLTYEGLLDDHFGISSGTVEFEPTQIGGQAKSIKWILNAQDEIFQDIRDRHFATVFSHLSSKAKEIQAVYNRKNDLKTVSDMRTFVSKHLKGTSSQHRSLGLHISACETIMQEKTSNGDFENQLRAEHNIVQGVDLRVCQQFIEDSILRCFPITSVLRLLCLYSLTWGGIPNRLFTQWKSDFLQSYGYGHLLTLQNLRRAGLFYDQDTGSVNLAKIGVRKSRFSNLAKSLNLLPARKTDCDIRNPKDVSYIFNGAYVPLTYRLVEQVLLANKLPGFAEAAKSLAYSQCQQEVRKASPHSQRNVMVFILGGCSYSELAAFRALGRSLELNIIVASTSFFGGHKLIQTLLQPQSGHSP